MKPINESVRQIEGQKVISEREITGSEAEEILRKYGYYNNEYSSINEIKPKSNKDLTFEEMCQLEEDKLKMDRDKQLQKMSGVKPITFTSNGYQSKTVSGDIDGYGFKIDIVSDMKF